MGRTGAAVVVVMVSMLGTRAEASCISVYNCFCLGGSAVGIGVTEQLDGGSALLRVESANVGLDAGALSTWASEAGEVAGSRWLLIDGQRLPVDASGNVTCQYVPDKPLPATAVATAAASPSTCESELSALGLKQPPCNDTGRCAVSPVLLSPLLLLAWFLSTRSRSRR